MRGDICGALGNRYINSQSKNQGHSHGETWAKPYSRSQSQNQSQSQSQRCIRYIDANNLYG